MPSELNLPSLELTEAQLQSTIKKARTGDQMAFSALLDHYWKEVYHFQAARTRNDNDAEDITIQTFSRAFDKIDTYDPSYNFKTWLFTISKNLHVDLLRKSRRNVLEGYDHHNGDAIKSVLDDSPSAEDKLIIEQQLASLLQHIKALKPHYQQVLNLRYFQEFSYAEIAKELDEPINNVKVKLLRAKKLLAARIREQG